MKNINEQFWDYAIKYMHDLANRINPDPSHVNVIFLEDFSYIEDDDDLETAAGSCELFTNNDFSSFNIQIMFSIENIKICFNEYPYKFGNIFYSGMITLKEIVIHEMRHAKQYIYGIKKYGLENAIKLLMQDADDKYDDRIPEVEAAAYVATKLTIDFHPDVTNDYLLEKLYKDLIIQFKQNQKENKNGSPS